MDQDRVKALRAYDVLDTPSEPEFDALVSKAARIVGAPIALISFVDEHRQWFKARVGLDVEETPIASSFCTHAIRGKGVFTVKDATRDERFATNPLVTGDPGIRFYAGVPLQAANGQRIGTLCVIDRQVRPALTQDEQRGLSNLAGEVMALMEARRAHRKPPRGPDW